MVFRSLSTCVVCPRDRSSQPLGTGLQAFSGLKPPLTPSRIPTLTPNLSHRANLHVLSEYGNFTQSHLLTSSLMWPQEVEWPRTPRASKGVGRAVVASVLVAGII